MAVVYSFFVLLIFDIHEVNEALLLNVKPFSALLLSLADGTIIPIAPLTAIFGSQ